MESKAVFENIAGEIISEILQAKKTIYVAVAWFTHRGLLRALLRQQEKGVKVHLIISDDEINRLKLDFSEIKNFYMVGNGDDDLMHNKFCVIDHSTVIMGSFNWTNKGNKQNHESIIITKGDTVLAEQFIKQFHEILKHYLIESEINIQEFPIDEIVRRLDVLKNYITLREFEEITQIVEKLEKYIFNENIQEIVTLLNNKLYTDVIIKIDQFIKQYNQVSIYQDPRVSALKLEMRIFENRLTGYENQKLEMEKLIGDFQRRHTLELGTIIVEILKIRKIKAEQNNNINDFENAQEDENFYQEQVDVEKEKEIQELSEEEKIQLKESFSKAIHLTHPDKVSEEFKESAAKTFALLKEARDRNDLEKVLEILRDLELGTYSSVSESENQFEILSHSLEKIKKKVIKLENEIITMKQSDTWDILINIENWDDYFQNAKEKLTEELKDLKKEVLELE